MFLSCSYFFWDFSLDVLIKGVLIKKKRCTHFLRCMAGSPEMGCRPPWLPAAAALRWAARTAAAAAATVST